MKVGSDTWNVHESSCTHNSHVDIIEFQTFLLSKHSLEILSSTCIESCLLTLFHCVGSDTLNFLGKQTLKKKFLRCGSRKYMTYNNLVVSDKKTIISLFNELVIVISKVYIGLMELHML